ncbi:MAG: DNA transformation protein [Planctomycetota bacterium]|jgi:DNA transformation protein
MSQEDLDYVLGQLSQFPGVVSRPMFGGQGLYQEGVFFGLLDRSGQLFFHTDKASRAQYIEAGSEGFRPGGESKTMPRYWEVPQEVLDAPTQLADWAEVARVSAAERKRPKKSKRLKKKTGSSGTLINDPNDRISSLRGLGAVTERWLKAVGVCTRGDLEAAGSLATYMAVLKDGQKASLNLLWTLEGALLDLDWRKIPPPVKDSLLQRLDRLNS